MRKKINVRDKFKNSRDKSSNYLRFIRMSDLNLQKRGESGGKRRILKKQKK